MTPPDLTPEQMNDAVRLADEEWRRWPYRASSDRVKALSAAITRALPVLFAAWQEQTAAQAGKNPYPTTDAVYAVQHAAWARGAAAGVAASEKRVREALEDVREKASTLVASTLTTGLPAEEFIEDAYGVANALDALAALLSEEPGAG